MTLKLSHLARQDLEDIRIYTVEQWGRAQWLDYYRGLVGALEKIKANPISGRSRDLRGGSGELNSWDRWIFRATAA